MQVKEGAGTAFLGGGATSFSLQLTNPYRFILQVQRGKQPISVADAG